jgi:ERCC4-type nuclease
VSSFEVSPSEPLAVRSLGVVSSLPERVGSDVVWVGSAGLVGVQRKTLDDLVVGLRSGRLGQEAARMRGLGVAVLLVEGRLRWSGSGRLTTSRSGLSREVLRGVCWSAQQRGIWVVFTDDVADTVATVRHLRQWLERRHHTSMHAGPLRKRAGPAPSPPGRDWGVQVLRSFPLVGPVVAGSVWDHFGRLPLRWECDEAELAAVPGVGPKRATALIEALSVRPAGQLPLELTA